MFRTMLSPFALVLATVPFAAPALAQDAPAKGIYAVARAGASINPEQKFDNGTLPATATFAEKTKFKTGITGEIGGGYDFGMFRVEQTIGYTGSNLKLDDATAGGFVAGGKTRSYTVSVAGYVDIPTGSIVSPFVGGGIGASRVEAGLTRVNAQGVGSSYSGKDWGLTWHADAGVGVEVMPKTTVELAGRYSQTSKLRFDGQNAGVATSYEPKLRALSATLGVRYLF